MPLAASRIESLPMPTPQICIVVQTDESPSTRRSVLAVPELEHEQARWVLTKQPLQAQASATFQFSHAQGQGSSVAGRKLCAASPRMCFTRRALTWSSPMMAPSCSTIQSRVLAAAGRRVPPRGANRHPQARVQSVSLFSN